MKHDTCSIARVVATLLVAGSTVASHGHEQAAAVAPGAGGEASPRFAAVSETFELVGVLSGRQLTLYLDRYADNSPVRDARIEVEIAGTALQATQQPGADAYQVVLAEAPKPGVLAVTATVIAGDESDLLAGELDVHPAAHAAAPAASAIAWRPIGGWLVGGAVVLALLVWGWRRVVSARQVAPKVAHEAAHGAGHEATHEAALEVAPKAAHDTAYDTAPKATHEVASRAAHKAVPDTAHDTPRTARAGSAA